MLKSNLSFKNLTLEQIEKIHKSTLQVMENTGVLFENDEAKEILSGIGCKISNSSRCYFPPELVEKSIKMTPSTFTLYNRNGEECIQLGDRKTYYGSVASLPFISDPQGNMRKYTLQDCKEMTVIMDSLNTLDFSTTTGMVSDVPPEVSDVHEINCVIENSAKPLLMTTHDLKGLNTITEICSIYKGSSKNFKEKPFVICCASPISPLKYPNAVAAKLITAVKSGYPFVVVPAPMAGGTTPISLAGTLVTGNAEILAGLVLTQAVSPGAPFLYGGFFSSLDMRTSVFTHGSPEFNLFNTALSEISQFYKIPSFSSAGCTDSFTIDGQAVFESGMSILFTLLTGANLVHAAGVMGSGIGVCKEFLLISDELINYISRICRGIEIDERRLAEEEIHNAVVNGLDSFLETELTMELFRSEFWSPRFFERNFHDKWKSKNESLPTKLSKECERILSTHNEIVDLKIIKEIEKIISSSDKERLG